MSLWLIGLGASVGYLIMKQERVQSTLDEQRKVYDAAREAEPGTEGLSTVLLDKQSTSLVNARGDGDETNPELPKSDKARLEAGAAALQAQAHQYHGESGQITGVWLDAIPS